MCVFCRYYDGLHVGHVASLVRASRFGNRLVVGVHSDEDYIRTKYKPEKNNALLNPCLARCSAVAAVPCVDQVIMGCPLTLSTEFISQEHIHLVGMSDEYVFARDPVTNKITECDHTYAPVMANLVSIPRTIGFSSSQLRDAEAATFNNFRRLETLVTNLQSRTEQMAAHLGLAPIAAPNSPSPSSSSVSNASSGSAVEAEKEPEESEEEEEERQIPATPVSIIRTRAQIKSARKDLASSKKNRTGRKR